MKFESSIISSIIEKNYSILMPIFFEMQTEYLASLNLIYRDLDASLVGMVLTNYLYKSKIERNGSAENISFQNFYNKDYYTMSSSAVKINKVSSIINIPRETVRRKRDKLIKDKILYLDKKKKLLSLNTDKIDRRILNLQIENLSKFLSKFTTFFVEKKLLNKSLTFDQIKKDLDTKFLIYLTKFLDFQILYFSSLKKMMDIESIFIALLCILNCTSQLKKENKVMSYKDVIQNIENMKSSVGLNVSSIAEITKIPRTTVIRKINALEKKGFVRRDKFKRYFIGDPSSKNATKTMLPIIDYNRTILANFFIECFYIYQKK